MKKNSVLERRPAETKAGALGGFTIVLISFLEALGITLSSAWVKVVTGVVALAPACFTWLDLHDGLRGLVRSIVGGHHNVPPVPLPDPSVTEVR